MYYKVAYNQEIIDVLDNIQYVKYQPRNKMLILSDQFNGSVGLCSSNGEIYRLAEQPETIGFDINKVVKLIEIEEDEYEILKEALGLNEKIEYNDIPKPFRGTPIVLLTACLMAIAFMGFSGMVSV